MFPGVYRSCSLEARGPVAWRRSRSRCVLGHCKSPSHAKQALLDPEIQSLITKCSEQLNFNKIEKKKTDHKD